MKAIILVLAAVLLAGCEHSDDYKQTIRPEQITYKNSNRFKVERVGVFADGLAYQSQRGIYLITDTETNQEFVGVSGVGISELASHQSGKTTTRDER
ncbi:hypothetical protein [Agrobacterium tumefaciens]|uniref:hypothetical protein n=1 Tax=Agrobacterium tumefaciens TaxID=358 RepID=UPI001573FE59|nr:hypothetical protein [Agrobacterium tumefaciens]